MVDDVQLFGNQPHAATRFLRPMLMIGTFTSIGMTIADLIALEATADRDVSGCVMARGWLWLQAGLQALHSIVRVFLFLTISGNDPRCGRHRSVRRQFRQWLDRGGGYRLLPQTS